MGIVDRGDLHLQIHFNCQVADIDSNAVTPASQFSHWSSGFTLLHFRGGVTQIGHNGDDKLIQHQCTLEAWAHVSAIIGLFHFYISQMARDFEM